MTRKPKVNFTLLSNALYQQGPWKNKKIDLNTNWLDDALTKKVNSIDWKIATQDIAPFIKPYEQPSLLVWDNDFFNTEIRNLVSYLNN